MPTKNGPPGAGDAERLEGWTINDSQPLAPATKQIKRADAEAAIWLLAELFPRAFFIFEQRRQPLKIGVRDDILARTNGAIAPGELAAALRFYCSNIGYLRAVARGGSRIDLDGSATDTVSAEHSAQAIAELKARAQCLRRQRQRKADAANPSTVVEPAPVKRLGLADLRRAGQLRASEAGRG